MAVRDVPRGSIAIVSQSGATASYICRYATQQQIGLSAMVSTGNEGDLGVADILAHFADDPATRVVILFIEAVRDAAGLRRAALRASRNGKPVIVLKVGSSDATAQVAQAHTGSIVGDDRVFSAACRALGMIRVDTVEEAVATAALLDEVGELGPGGLAAMAISGGICGVVGDTADVHGVELCSFSGPTRAALATHLPDFGTAHNPLDLTGAAVLKPEIFEGAAHELVRDPSAALAAAIFDMPEEDPFGLKVLGHIAAGFSGAATPGVVISIAPKPVSPHYRAQVREAGVVFLGCGLDVGLQAIRNAFRWSRRKVQDVEEATPTRPLAARPLAARPLTEPGVLAELERRGVSVVPGRVVTEPAAAAAAAQEIGGPVAMKIVSPQIAHKSDIGGVRLNVGAAEAAEAFARIMADCAAARPDATLEGVVVSPMRERGVELFIGVTVDPQWGATLALGLGGVWIELLRDTALRLLPVTQPDVVEMLGELKAARLLHGYRGGEAVDIGRLAEEICRIAGAALDMGPHLRTLEINPLLCRGSRVEALDALAEWNDPC
jgi:acyl-CoA synthetase (NDP forming)